MVTDILNSSLFQPLLMGGISIAMACIAYFERKIIKNQEELKVIHHIVIDLKKDVDGLKRNVTEAKEVMKDYEKEQQFINQKITGELSRLGTITDIWFTKWDGIERRAN